MPNLPTISRKRDVAGPRDAELAWRDLTSIGNAMSELTNAMGGAFSEAAFTRAIGLAETVLETHDLIETTIVELSRPATMAEIRAQCAGLIASFPNAGRADSAFGPILVEDIAAAEPTIGALSQAVRKLRRTSTFLPAIAEVLAALGAAESYLGVAPSRLQRLAKLTEEAREYRESSLAFLQKERARILGDVRRRLADGKGVEYAPPDIVAEAHAAIAAERG